MNQGQLIKSTSSIENYINNCEWNKVKQLLEQNCSPGAWEEDSMNRETIMHLLAMSSDIPEEILSRVISMFPKSLMLQDEYYDTPLHVAMRHSTSEEMINYLILACPQAVALQEVDGNTVLHLALMRNVPDDIIALLLLVNPDVISKTNTDLQTPLHVACINDASLETVRLLAELDPSAILMEDIRGLSPLFAISKELEINVNIEKTNGSFPTSVSDGLVECSKILLSISAGTYRIHKQHNISDEKNIPIVGMISLARECPEFLFDYIVQKFKFTAHQCDHRGNLPLHLACFKWSKSRYLAEEVTNRRLTQKTAIKSLLKAYPGAIYHKSRENRYPLHLAIVNGVFWENGLYDLFEAAPEMLSISDGKTGLYPFMLAATTKSHTKDKQHTHLSTIFQLLLSAPEVLKTLTDNLE